MEKLKRRISHILPAMWLRRTKPRDVTGTISFLVRIAVKGYINSLCASFFTVEQFTAGIIFIMHSEKLRKESNMSGCWCGYTAPFRYVGIFGKIFRNDKLLVNGLLVERLYWIFFRQQVITQWTPGIISHGVVYPF